MYSNYANHTHGMRYDWPTIQGRHSRAISSRLEVKSLAASGRYKPKKTENKLGLLHQHQVVSAADTEDGYDEVDPKDLGEWSNVPRDDVARQLAVDRNEAQNEVDKQRLEASRQRQEPRQAFEGFSGYNGLEIVRVESEAQKAKKHWQRLEAYRQRRKYRRAFQGSAAL